MRKRILMGLLFATIAISAWGLMVEEAMAGELRSKEDFTVEVVARRAPLGLTVQPIVEGAPASGPAEERAPLYESNSSESSESSSED